MDSAWVLGFGEHVFFWPGVVLLLVVYVGGLAAAFSHYRSWIERGLYFVTLTVSMAVLFAILEVITLRQK